MSNLIFELANPISQINLDELRSIAGTGPVLILTHDNPDPDALASGKALATLFREAWGISARPRLQRISGPCREQSCAQTLDPGMGT
jgi:hypothetical protein